MNTQIFLALSLFSALLFAGCHHGAYDDYRNYSGSDSYREGYRDGRAAERRRMDTRYGRYYDRDYWGWR